jgi:hypothetical protein
MTIGLFLLLAFVILWTLFVPAETYETKTDFYKEFNKLEFGGSPDPTNSMFLPVAPLKQFDCTEWDHVYCVTTTEAMVLRYFDDAFGTNYLGNPYDQSLVCEYLNVPYGTLQERLDYWCEYRDQPKLSVDIYWDTEYITAKNIDITIPPWSDVIVTDINYNLYKTILNTGVPVITYISTGPGGVTHAMCGYGWCDETSPLPFPQVYTWNTWDTAEPCPHQIDKYHYDEYWYVKSIRVVTFLENENGDMNGDNEVDSGDVRYLAMHLVGDPLYAVLDFDKGDVNNDNNLDSGDVRYLAMYLVGDPLYSPLYP